MQQELVPALLHDLRNENGDASVWELCGQSLDQPKHRFMQGPVLRWCHDQARRSKPCGFSRLFDVAMPPLPQRVVLIRTFRAGETYQMDREHILRQAHSESNGLVGQL